MPVFQLFTNVEVQDPKAFALEFSKFGASLLNVPEAVITTYYQYSPTLTFGGTFDPAFTLTITGLNFTPEKNIVNSKRVFEFVEKQLQIPDDRGFITFFAPEASSIGYKSTTIDVLANRK